MSEDAKKDIKNSVYCDLELEIICTAHDCADPIFQPINFSVVPSCTTHAHILVSHNVVRLSYSKRCFAV